MKEKYEEYRDIENSSEWARNEFINDPRAISQYLDVLDFGNGAQKLTNKVFKNSPNETQRAASNFDKVVEGKHRPASHNLVDITRVIPDLLALVGPSLLKTAIKAGGKGITKKIGEKAVKETAVNVIRNTPIDEVGTHLTTRDAKRRIQTKWISDLMSDDNIRKFAKRKDIDPTSVRNVIIESKDDNIKEALHSKINGLNKRIDNDMDLLKELKIKYMTDSMKKAMLSEIDDINKPVNIKAFNNLKIKYMDDNIITLNKLGGLSDETKEGIVEVSKNLPTKKLIDAMEANPKEYVEVLGSPTNRYVRMLQELKNNPVPSGAHYQDWYTSKVLSRYPIQKDKLKAKDFISKAPTAVAVGFVKGADAFDSSIDSGIEKATALSEDDIFKLRDNGLRMGNNYYYGGTLPTPVKDVIFSILGMDYNDPARFNEKDVEGFIKFLVDIGQVDPKAVKKLSPRQKVGLMRNIMKTDRADFIRSKWLEKENGDR